MKHKFYKVLLGIFGIIGLASCAPRLYGPAPIDPHKVKGRITDEKGNPIKGIKILSDVDTYIPIDPDTQKPIKEVEDINMMRAKSSGEDGSYEIRADYLMSTIYYFDIDGEENGGNFECTAVQLQGGDYNRNKESTVDVTMKKIAGEDAGDENTPESEE